jgi:hypothetical protein
MPTQNRKPRSDSITTAVSAAKLARDEQPFLWPDHIELPANENDRDIALGTFAALQAAREPRWWRPHHRDSLAELSLLMGERQKLIMLLTKTGAMTTQNGRQTRSPVLDALSQLQGVITQSLKPLGISPTQLENDKHGAAISDARNVIEKSPLDDLLA